VINKILRPALAKICTAIWNTTCLSHHCHHCRNHHPPPHRAHVHYLISINVQQALMNVGTFVCVCVCVCVKEFSSTLLFHTHTHHVRLSLCCHLSHIKKNTMGYWWEGSVLKRHTTNPRLNVGQLHKIGGIPFRAALVKHSALRSILRT